jgi:hypothetical protein
MRDVHDLLARRIHLVSATAVFVLVRFVLKFFPRLHGAFLDAAD